MLNAILFSLALNFSAVVAYGKYLRVQKSELSISGSGFSSKIAALKKRLHRPNPSSKRLRVFGELAAFLDACVLCLDAGLSLPAAFEEAASRLHSSEIHDSARRVMRHSKLGATFSQALLNSKTLISGDPFHEVIDAMLVSLRLGSDLGASLDGLAEQYRAKAKSQVEEMAAQAPVKMLFPLVFFVLPVIFILLGSGTIEQLMSSFSKM